MQTSFEVEQLKGTSIAMIGCGPFVDVQTNNFYYTDKSISSQIFRYDIETEKFFTATVPGQNGISFIFPIEGEKDQFIVGADKQLLLINWDGFTIVAEVIRVLCELSVTGVCFNDAKTDSYGRLYVGTKIDASGDMFDFSRRAGSLYVYTMQNGLVELKNNVGFANGIAFNERLNIMYFVDSYDLNIKQFSWDSKTGKVANEKIIDLSKYGKHKEVFPDGLTIDIEGNLYVAMFGGGKILKINPATKKIKEIETPIEQVTSMVFGGKTLRSMYITSSGSDNSKFMKDGKKKTITYPNGYTFRIKDMGVAGIEFNHFKLAVQ